MWTRWLSCCALGAILGLGPSGCVANNPDYCDPNAPGCAVTFDGGGQADLSASGGEDWRTGDEVDMRRNEPPDLTQTCTDPGDCPSEICQPDGTCANPDDVIYVDNQNGTCRGPHRGDQADPFCLSYQAVDLAHMTGKKLIHIAGSIARYNAVQLDNIRVGIYGPGGYASPAARLESDGALGVALPPVEVSGNSAVLIDGLELTNAYVDLATCTSDNGPMPSLRLFRSRLHFGGSNGLYARKCKVSVDRTVIGRNASAGILLDQNSEGTVVNSVIAQNGRIGIDAQQGILKLNFTTVAENGTVGLGAIDCGPAGTPSRLIETSLVVYNVHVRNGGQMSDGCRLVNSASDDVNWPNGSGNRFLARPDFAPNTVFHLQRTFNSTQCCIDQLDRGQAGGVVVDLEGTPRPQGPRWDIGALETR